MEELLNADGYLSGNKIKKMIQGKNSHILSIDQLILDAVNKNKMSVEITDYVRRSGLALNDFELNYVKNHYNSEMKWVERVIAENFHHSTTEYYISWR